MTATRWPSATAAAIAVVLALTRCGTAAGLDGAARVAGGDFDHQVIDRAAGVSEGAIHVYIEGDGRPWIGETRVSHDPTPRRRVALELMSIDPAPAIYLGRPCHFGLARSRNCSPRVWTHARYGPEVLASMEAALRSALGARASRPLVLVGFSGGGTLAQLLAPRFETTAAVITIGANLDIDAWAAWHGYSPLDGSLNPSSRPPLPSGIRQIHLVGERDPTVPPTLALPVIERLKQTATVLPGADHTCCWTPVWPEILERLGYNYLLQSQIIDDR